MGEGKREIVFYKKASGESPVEAFLDQMPGKVAQKIVWVLRLAEDLERVPEQYFCKLTDTEGIWEFRIRSGMNNYRILAFWDEGRLVLTHGFLKKSPKTPLKEIEQAQNCRRVHFERKG